MRRIVQLIRWFVINGRVNTKIEELRQFELEQGLQPIPAPSSALPPVVPYLTLARF